MSMRNFMKDLMRDQNVSEVCIVHDASISSLPDDDFMGDSSTFSQSDDSGSMHLREVTQAENSTRATTSPGNLLEFRERHRRIKEMLSPLKDCKFSPNVNASSLQRQSKRTTIPRNKVLRQKGDIRSQLKRLASDSSIISGPPSLEL